MFVKHLMLHRPLHEIDLPLVDPLQAFRKLCNMDWQMDHVQLAIFWLDEIAFQQLEVFQHCDRVIVSGAGFIG